MSFREPALLAVLLLVPVALVAYRLAQRRRRRYAIRFPAVDVLAPVAGRAWGRHVPAALALAAIAVLAVALAQPQRTIAVERRQGTVVLVHDTSGSMLATDVRPNRLSAARTSARKLTQALPSSFRLGLVAFGSTAEQISEPTTDRQQILGALDRLRVHGATAMGEGLKLGVNAIRRPVTGANGRPQQIPGAIVLLSDGASTRGVDPRDVAKTAARFKIPIYTIALGTAGGTLATSDGGTTPVPPDTEVLQDLARTTKGRFFAAPTAADLGSVYANLGRDIALGKEQQQMTAAFAGGALALLVGGFLVGMIRTGRLP
jgi:Ca-activated chloride channel family protein